MEDGEYEIETVTGPVTKLRRIQIGINFIDESPIGGTMFVSITESSGAYGGRD